MLTAVAEINCHFFGVSLHSDPCKEDLFNFDTFFRVNLPTSEVAFLICPPLSSSFFLLFSSPICSHHYSFASNDKQQNVFSNTILRIYADFTTMSTEVKAHSLIMYSDRLSDRNDFRNGNIGRTSEQSSQYKIESFKLEIRQSLQNQNQGD